MIKRLDEVPYAYLGSGYRLALHTLARIALTELIAARGDGRWLEELEQEVFNIFRNRPVPGVPVEFENRVIDEMEVLVEAIIDEARGRGVMVLD